MVCKLFICDDKTCTVTVQSQLCGDLMFSSMVSHTVPVSSEISDFTLYAHAQSNILHIQYAEKTDD